MSDLNKLKELVKLHTREFDLHKADPRNPSKLAAWDYASSLLNDEIDRDAVGLVTQILGELESAQKRITELESRESRVSKLVTDNETSWQTLCLRLEAAEAELSRRDAAAGEPVEWQFLTDSGKWFSIHDPDEATKYGYKIRGLFPATQPSALPPECTETPDNLKNDLSDAEKNSWISGANCMREHAKALGCKAIKLPPLSKSDKNFYGVLGEGYEAWLEARTAHAVWNEAIKRCTVALNEQGFTVEGE